MGGVDLVLRIELENLWRRLTVRFKARTKSDEDPDDPQYPLLLETVQPITDFDELAKQWDINEFTAARTHVSGSGYEQVCMVPQGKKWHVRTVQIVRTAGDMTLSQLLLVKGGTREVSIVDQAAASAIVTNLLPQDIVMNEGSELRMFCVAVAADTTWNIDVYRAEEDAF